MNNCKQAGLSLTELLLASAIGLMLTSLMLKLFRDQVDHFKFIQASDQTLYELQYTVSHIEKAVQMAGFAGCAHMNDQNLQLTNHVGWLKLEQRPLMVYPANAMLAAHKEMPVAPNTSVIRVQRASELGGQLLAMPAVDQLIVNDDVRFKKGQVIVVSNCSRMDIVSVQRVVSYQAGQYQRLYLSYPLSVNYASGSFVSNMRDDVYYVSNTKGYYALYQRDIYQVDHELSRGTRNIHLLLEEHKQNAADLFLLVQSEYQVNATPQWYDFSGQVQLAEDRRFYRAIHYVIPLPNPA
jgi:Tfp pilus assembly protein PilW